MEKVLLAEKLAYNNVLYIGDNARECLRIIEKFTLRLRKIEIQYGSLVTNNTDENAAPYPISLRGRYSHF